MKQTKKNSFDEHIYGLIYFQLGTGRFGYVQLAEHKQSKLKIALKFFPRPQIKQVQSKKEFIIDFLNTGWTNRVEIVDSRKYDS